MTVKTSHDPIKVDYKGIDGALHEAFIQPLKRKDGVEVLHLILGALGGSLTTDTIAELSKGNTAAIFALVGKLIQGIAFEDFWKIADKLLRFAVIDSKQCDSLDNYDGFNGHFADLYALVFEALKVNYPDFFGAMGLNGSTESISPAEVKP